MKALPDYIEFKQFPGTPLKDIFTAAADDLISLLGKLLCLNPSERYNCSQALQMPYFSNKPGPTPNPQLPLPSGTSAEILKEDHKVKVGVKRKLPADSDPNPPLIAYRRNKNLRDTLVRAQIPRENKNFITKNIPPGSYPCGRKCLTCTYVRKSKDFQSHRTSRRYTIRAHITCRTRNIIYMIQCKKCGIQYVGETGQTLANRMNGHRSSIKTDKDTPIAAHFNQPSHTVADMEVVGLEKLAYGRTEDLTRQRRLSRESYWIHQLRTLHPEGLNLESLEITRV
ncbi:CDK7 [Branchiostoma lanceolatum]|uniref:CDK7 protein n=1 Tax=Branchiostoma lanceolatum TaxID=7740 RepID=A0A8K0EL83_BRALA|nr:CDK7 [Branchiostoma lanceolatum]